MLMSHAELLLLGAEAAQRGWIAGDPQVLCHQGIEASMLQHGVAQAAIDDYLAATTCNTLDEILTQKWIALFMAGPEAFAEVRRTNIPDLPLATKAVIEVPPARMPYPADEGLYNSNFAPPISELNITDPLWWMP
ncbi:MAG: SusD/RagB family nutrient-binding outer membrane lipoprotein [Gemmatimonas sp.]|nr:SusD/RagB family nutrient-binding outer membrane lipoprotein [Gemmatimonas sp.]